MLRKKLESSIINSLHRCDTATLIAVHRSLKKIERRPLGVKHQIYDLIEFCDDERVLEIIRQILIRN